MKNRLRLEKIQQGNLIKLTLDSNLKIKMNYLKRSESKRSLSGVSCGHSTCYRKTRPSNFFGVQLGQVQSHSILELKA